jgi:hypothetical protein
MFCCFKTMKKLLAILFLILSSSLFTFCVAQQEFGQIVINAGVGYSPEFDGNIGGLLSIVPPILRTGVRQS